jgi:hypothetical protein
MNISKKKMIIWAVVIAVSSLILVFYAAPRITNCWLYHELISSEPQNLEILSVKPQKIELPPPNRSCVFPLGYAQTPLCPDYMSSILYIQGVRIVCRCDSSRITYSFFLPENPAEATYEMLVEAANVMPINYFEMFFSKPRSIYYRIMSAYILKVSQPCNRRGIGLFETENIKGLISFGLKDNPCVLHAEIFSKDGNVSQEITVFSESPQKSKEALLSLLSSYRFTITQTPEINYLDELIINELGDNSKFKIDNKNQ